MIYPINVPILPARCPNCGEREDKKTVCRHCDWEHPGETSRGWSLLWVFVLLPVVICLLGWAGLTIIFWLYPVDGPRISLLQTVLNQLDYIRGAKIW